MTSPHPGMARREQFAWVIAGALALLLIGRVAIDRSDDSAAAAAADPSVGQARSAVTNLMVRDSAQTRVALAPRGRPAILMVSSKSCAFCKLALKDIAALQGRDGVPMLRVVTLEGVEAGASMLASLGVHGAFNSGPDGESDQVLLTFRIPGTPVFARTDSAGNIVETVPGYPGPKVLARWLPVMRGQ
jgi:thioredoxin-related protein